MGSVCISSCVDDTQVIPPRVRATYVNLHRWPESEAEFVRSLGLRSMSSDARSGPKVVDIISCRQDYLRSYTFTRKETTVNKRTAAIKCFGKVKHKLVNANNNKNKHENYFGGFKSFFKNLLFCSC